MRNQISLFICLLILLVPAARAQTPPSTPPWNVYTIKGERLSIALPRLPSLQTFKETRKPPQNDRKKNVVSCAVKGVNYTVQVMENPKPRLTLEAFIQEQAAPYIDKLTFERDLTLDGIAGKSFRYKDGTGMVQFFASNSRLYVIGASGAPVDDPRVATFFHYFSFKTQEGAIQVSQLVQADTTSEKTFIGKEVDSKVRLLSKPEPSYTGAAKNEQITGVVILKCVFAADGTVTNIRVVQGLPKGLTERAIAAARQIKFIPATKDGRNVSMWMQLEYNFNLY